MVLWDGEWTTAWWQIDLETGETVGVGEEGMHSSIVQFIGMIIFTVVVLEVIIASPLNAR
jgi:hypothetical protein